MKTLPIAGPMIDAVVGELGQSPLFSDLTREELHKLASGAAMLQCEQGETLMQEGDPSDSFFLVASGEVIIKARHIKRNEYVEVARVKPFDTIGELGLLLEKPRSATVITAEASVLLKFTKPFFFEMFKQLPNFGLVTCRILARRLQQSSQSLVVPMASEQDTRPDPAALHLLPIEFIQRHRVLPLRTEGHILHVGFPEDPSPQVISLVHDILPAIELRPIRIDVKTFQAALESKSGSEPGPAPGKKVKKDAGDNSTVSASPRLDQLLKRMVAEGASDLHLSAGQKPRWRIDGDMHEIPDATPLSASEVIEITDSVMLERNRSQFREENDTDFAYAIPSVARFRVNLFRDNKGAGAVFRQIPDKILSVQQLGLPKIILEVCDYPKGLVVVTGPTGSGKSTTLAAMIDHINRSRKAHIITLEDPIEFVHPSQQCLVNQREVGPHTSSFARALRAALREDPDIVLVGEMRDLETVALALETANTGHLVFGTLHTNTAVSTISRIVDMFPSGQQNQVRTVLADTLKGVIAQTLCRRIGGGRIAAIEILVSDLGMANLIREGKTQQLFSAMQMGKARGNRVLNEELARIVSEGLVDPEEALSKAADKPDLAKRLGIPIQ